jgi:hypothetical protein
MGLKSLPNYSMLNKFVHSVGVLEVLDGSLIPASAVLAYGPGNDKTPVRELMCKASRSVQPYFLYAGAGYDMEWIHRYCHED